MFSNLFYSYWKRNAAAIILHLCHKTFCSPLFLLWIPPRFLWIPNFETFQIVTKINGHYQTTLNFSFLYQNIVIKRAETRKIVDKIQNMVVSESKHFRVDDLEYFWLSDPITFRNCFLGVYILLCTVVKLTKLITVVSSCLFQSD